MGNNENINRSRKRMIFENFLGGISWSVGVWIGTTFIFALGVLFLSKINLVPMVGTFVAEVMKYAAQANSPFNF